MSYQDDVARLNAIHREIKLTLGDSAEPQVINKKLRAQLIDYANEYATLVSQIVVQARQPVEGGD